MKKQLLLILCLLSFSISQSQTFNDGVLEYTVISGTNVSVKKYNNTCPTGNHLTIPNTVVDAGTTYTITEIENFGFKGCSMINVTIPNTVTLIGNEAFNSCLSLSGTLNIPNSVISIGNNAFELCNQLTSLIIGSSVTTIGDFAFMDCSGLTSLSIPNSVTSIGGYAFYYCTGLTSLSIPNSVTSIGSYAFYNCSGLTSVTVDWATPLVVPADVFQNVNVSVIPLTVPSGTVALYQAATVWQDFGSFVLSTENFTENNINVALFPNPVNNTLNIALDTAISKVVIYNLQGQKVKESTTEQVNVATLSQGIYLIKIEDENGNTAMKKFIKK